jgi:hypothetical protein
LGDERVAVEGRIEAAREATEDAVQKLYRRSQGGHGYGYAQGLGTGEDYVDPYELKHKIEDLVAAFDATIDAEGAAWDAFVDAQLDAFNTVAAGERDALAALCASELANWDAEANGATNTLADSIAQ